MSPASSTVFGTCTGSSYIADTLTTVPTLSSLLLAPLSLLPPPPILSVRRDYAHGFREGRRRRKIGYFFLLVFQKFCIFRGTKREKDLKRGFSFSYNRNKIKPKPNTLEIYSPSSGYKDNNGEAIGFPGWRGQQTGSRTTSQPPSALARVRVISCTW